MGFTPEQVHQLLRPINPNRVLKDGKGHSHVSQQDVIAHLIRVFGFGNFDIDVLSCDLVFEAERVGNNGEVNGRWDCCYRAMVRLTVRDATGHDIAHYEDGSTATAQNQTRGDAHDLAYKSAISLSKKRAAVALGDQFGLSLYNRGQLDALVKGTIVRPDGDTAAEDVQDGVPQQVSLGNDEIERDLAADNDGPPRNKDGSLSRSRMSDDELAAAGAMTGPQTREHGRLVKETQANPRKADRTQGPIEADPWANGGGMVTRTQLTRIVELFNQAQWHDETDRLRAASALVGREVANAYDLSSDEAETIIAALRVATDDADPATRLADMVTKLREQEGAPS